jgi:DNA-binding HxlR family transcriptional regulator
MGWMQRTSLAEMPCSLARTVDLAGEWWTPLIVRDIHFGLTRFDDIQRNLGISRKVLTQRLDRLVEHGVVERRPYQERPLRHDYVLTEKGNELMQALFVLISWGDRWTAGEAGPPLLLRHASCGEITSAEVTCACCGEPLTVESVKPEPGPGGRVARGTRVLARVFTRPRPA